MKTFSVVIPTYNRAALLRRALGSVWRQTFTDFEVIVVDDGSIDGTVEYLRTLGGRVRWLSQPNAGPGAARNLGARAASGEYVAFLDSDDFWFPWTLEVYDEVRRRHGSPSVVVGRPFVFKDESEAEATCKSPLRAEAFADYFASGDRWRWWGASSFVVRRDRLEQAGGFACGQINGEDADLMLKLGTAAGFVQVSEPHTFAYREHAGNLTRDFARLLRGSLHLLRQELGGAYPGGAGRSPERRRILTRHLRPVALACLREGRVGDGLRFYRQMFRWHLELGQWKFLGAFPALALAASLRRAKAG